MHLRAPSSHSNCRYTTLWRAREPVLETPARWCSVSDCFSSNKGFLDAESEDLAVSRAFQKCYSVREWIYIVLF